MSRRAPVRSRRAARAAPGARRPRPTSRSRSGGGPSGDLAIRCPETERPDVRAGQRRILGAADALDELDDQALLELGAGGVLEPAQRLLDRERLAIGTGRRHRGERVAHREDPRDERDPLALQPVEVAVAIPPLVVMADAGADDLDVRQVADD